MRQYFLLSVFVFTSLLFIDLSPATAESSSSPGLESRAAEVAPMDKLEINKLDKISTDGAPQRSTDMITESESEPDENSARGRLGLSEELEIFADSTLEEELLRAGFGTEDATPRVSSRHGRGHLSRKRLKQD